MTDRLKTAIHAYGFFNGFWYNTTTMVSRDNFDGFVRKKMIDQNATEELKEFDQLPAQEKDALYEDFQLAMDDGCRV